MCTGPDSDDFLLLRDFRDDYLPGAILYTSPVIPKTKTSTTSTIDLSSLGVKTVAPRNNKKKNASSGGNKDPKMTTLKKSGLRGDEMGELRVVVQIKNQAQSVVGAPPTGEFSIWALEATVTCVSDKSDETVATEEV